MEFPVAFVVVDDALLLEVGVRKPLLDFWIHVTVDLNDVRPAVVIVIYEPAAPADVIVVHADSGSEGDVAEGTVAVVVKEVTGIISEVGLENVKPAVSVVVRHPDSHAGLFPALIVNGGAAHQANVGERAIVVVVEHDASFGIDSHVDVRPAVVIEIVGDGADGIARARLLDAGLLGDVGESAIAVIVVENVGAARQAARSAQNRNPLPHASRRFGRQPAALL